MIGIGTIHQAHTLQIDAPALHPGRNEEVIQFGPDSCPKC
jgi:hypothetical protein